MRIFAFVLATVFSTSSAVRAKDISELGAHFGDDYRKKFAECDAHDTFDGKPISHLHRCRTDPSRFDLLARVPATDKSSEAIIFVSKIAHDDDGASAYCPPNHPKDTSQCRTALLLKATAAHPCQVGTDLDACVAVDPDSVPYAVVPGHSESVLHVEPGDYGMVLYAGRRVPVIVADTGPENKIGEGSTTLLRRLSEDGKARTLCQGATFVLFPHSKDAHSELQPDTLPHTVETRATDIYNAFRKANP